MPIKLASKNLLISLLILASVLLFSQISKSYDDKTTHPGLTDEIVDFYNLSFDDKLTNEEKEWIVQGSIDEDTPPRWINHFYDPIYKDGWSGENTGIWPTMLIQYFSGATLSSQDPVSSLNWLHNQTLQSEYGQYKGNRTWERAIYEMVQNGNKKEAYYTLGFIMHLIEDATVPDHTRNDTHAHELRYATFDYGSPYEEYAKQYSRSSLDGLNLAQNLLNKGEKPIVLNSIDEYLISLAEYSNKYFFSKDTIDTTDKPKYEFPKIIKIDENFGYGKDSDCQSKNPENDCKLFPLVNVKYYLAIEKNEVKKVYSYYLPKKDNNSTVLNAYFSRLSRRAVLSGAGIINLFKQEAAKAEKEKLQNLPKETSSVFSPTGRVYQFMGYISAAGNFIVNQVNNFQNSLPSSVLQILNNVNTQIQNNNQSLGTMGLLTLDKQAFESPKQAVVNRLVDLEPLSVQTLTESEPQITQPASNNNQSSATPPIAPPPTPPQIPTPQPPAQNNQNNQNNAVPWPGFVFAPPPPQAETNNQQQTTDNAPEENNNEPAPEQEPEPEPQDTTPPAKPIIASHQNNQYLNESADEVPDEPSAPEEDEENEENEDGETDETDEIDETNEDDESSQDGEITDDCSELSVVGCQLLVFSEGVQITLKGAADPDSEVLISQTAPNSNLALEEPSGIFADGGGNFQIQITLEEGENIFEIKVRDQAGNESEAEIITLILDLTPPETIDDLEANAGQNRGEINLTFTKPNDDSGIKEYEIRYSQKQIVETLTEPAEGEDANENEILFSDAEFSQIVNPSGQDQESATISNLDPSKKYYFAVKSTDLAENVSEISNIAQTNPSAKAEHLVISEFKIEGGNRNQGDDEFIELYNPTGQDVSLDGWSIQYLGSTAKKFENIEKKNFESEHKIPARGFFLIAKNNGYRGLTPPDMSHSSFSLSGYGGTIFLVASKEKLETSADLSIIDKVGYLRNQQDKKNIYPETNLLIITSNYNSSAAFERKYLKNSTAESLRDPNQDAFSGNAYDADDNAEDFVLQHPTTPQNSASLPEPKDETWNIKLADSPWPTAFYDQKGSRRSPNAGPKQNPKILWQADLTDNNLKTPAISQDNLLYVASQNFLSFLDLQNGQIKNQANTSNQDKSFAPGIYLGHPASGPAIDNSGTAYFAFSGASIISGISAVTSEGKIRFLKQSDDRHSFSNPPLLGDAMIYFLPGGGGYWDGGGLTALYPDGTKKWEFKTIATGGGLTPLMDENENFYIPAGVRSWGPAIGYLYKIDKNKNILFEVGLAPGNAVNCVLLGENYYFECASNSWNDNGVLNIFDKSGKLLLSEGAPIDNTGTVTQTGENEIIISRNYNGWSHPYRGRLYSYSILPNPEGVPKDANRYGIASNEIKIQFNWYFEMPENKAITIPIVDGQGVMYFADSGGKVYAFDPPKGAVDSITKKLSQDAVLWTLDLGLPQEGSQKDQIWYSNNLILDDKGVLYAVTEKGNVFAISEDLTPPAPEEEPMSEPEEGGGE